MDSNILSGLIAAGAALAGVAVTEIFSARRRRRDITEAHRGEQTTSLIELMASGREWSKELFQIALAAGLAPKPELFRLGLIQRYEAPEQRHRRALLAARLVVRDPQLHSLVRRLTDEFDKAPTLIAAVMKSRDEESDRIAQSEHIDAVSQKQDEYDEQLQNLESLVRSRLVDQVDVLNKSRS